MFGYSKILGFLLVLLMLLSVPPLHAQTDPGELENLIYQALEANPFISARRAERDAAQFRIPQAAALEDPHIGFQASNVPTNQWDFNSTPMSGKDFTLKQKLPFPGKLRFRKQAATSLAQGSFDLLQEEENRIRFDVERVYYTLYRLDKEIGVVSFNRNLLKTLSRVAESRYTTGQATGPDVFRTQTFTSELDNTLLALEQERASAVVRLNTLLNRDISTAVNLDYKFLLDPPPLNIDVTTASKNRPLLQALKNRIEASESQIRWARRNYWPDFDVGVTYRQRDQAPGDPVQGADFFSGSVQINIPLWAHWRQTPKLRESRAMKLAAEQNYQGELNETLYRAEEATQRLERQHHQIRLYERSLIPQTRATYESSYTAYQSNRVDFFSTIEALKKKFETELEYYNLKSDYQISRAELRWLLGEALSTPAQEETQP